MPKSKQQKQQEALERNRANIPGLRAYMLRWQPGGNLYDPLRLRCGKAKADESAQDHLKSFAKSCAEAKIDLHGNPL